jgi:nucleoside-diphosphate-sugar epimerase
MPCRLLSSELDACCAVLNSIAADSKNAHLLALDGAKERLTLCRADVLDRASLHAAFAGCNGVFHVASPVSNDPVSRRHCLIAPCFSFSFSFSQTVQYSTAMRYVLSC